MASPDRRDAQNFAGGCYSGPAFGHAVIDHGGHPGLYRSLVDGVAVGLCIDKTAHTLVDLQDLEDADPAPVPGAAASLATFGLVDRLPDPEPERIEAGIVGEVGRRKLALRLAAIAKLSHQALGDHGAQR